MELIAQKISQQVMNEDFWRKHYEIYKKTALSKASYSRQNNLIAPRFIYWSRKFEMGYVKPAKPSQPSHFAKVEIKEEKSQFLPLEIHPLCTLELGDNKRLLIHDRNVITILLNALGVN